MRISNKTANHSSRRRFFGEGTNTKHVTTFEFLYLSFYLYFLDELPSSVILQSGNNYISQLTKFLPIKSSSFLCWRATKDGWAVSTFHSKCNNKGPTVTIVRVGNYVFGGYTDLSWDSKIFSLFFKDANKKLFFM